MARRSGDPPPIATARPGQPVTGPGAPGPQKRAADGGAPEPKRPRMDDAARQQARARWTLEASTQRASRKGLKHCVEVGHLHLLEKLGDFVNFLKSEYARDRTPMPYHKVRRGRIDGIQGRTAKLFFAESSEASDAVKRLNGQTWRGALMQKSKSDKDPPVVADVKLWAKLAR